VIHVVPVGTRGWWLSFLPRVSLSGKPLRFTLGSTPTVPRSGTLESRNDDMCRALDECGCGGLGRDALPGRRFPTTSSLFSARNTGYHITSLRDSGGNSSRFLPVYLALDDGSDWLGSAILLLVRVSGRQVRSPGWSSRLAVFG